MVKCLRLAALTLLLITTTAAAELRVASWNIQNLGWGEHKRFDQLVEIIERFDLLAIQEVMDEEAAHRLRDTVAAHADEPWGLVYSDALGRTRYREKYAFLWREEAVEFTGEAVTYVDDADRFAREPMAARFRSRATGQQLVLSTLHAIYGDTVAERAAEVEALRSYFTWLRANFAEGDPIILAGDFNLAPTHPAWDRLRDVAYPAITSGATTVSTIEGRYANLYDNIWIAHETSLAVDDAAILRVPEILGMDHETMRRHVSDHVPVFIALNGAPSVSRESATDTNRPREPVPDAGPIRGNRNSDIYHRPDCPSYKRVAEHNRRHFQSERQARAAGYRVAGNCP